MVKVLIVDDDSQLVEMLGIALNLAGYQVLTAYDGDTACAKVVRDLPDIVLLDLKLPGKHGFEVCRQIRHTITDTYIPVIMVTAEDDLDSKIEGLEIGADDYIAKPFDTREIIARIKSMVRIKSLHDELRLAKNDLLELAVRDSLTSTYNRRYFLEILKLEIKKIRRYGGTLACLMLDVDEFKKINDSYGHPCGDKVLKRVADVMQDNLRSSDVVGRYGGDEFIAFLPNIQHTERLGVICNRICTMIEQVPVQTSSGTHTVTVSIGASVFDSSSMPDFEQIIEEVDAALYSAKHAGRNCCKLI